jgi:hypothetical protein
MIEASLIDPSKIEGLKQVSTEKDKKNFNNEKALRMAAKRKPK